MASLEPRKAEDWIPLRPRKALSGFKPRGNQGELSFPQATGLAFQGKLRFLRAPKSGLVLWFGAVDSAWLLWFACLWVSKPT